MAFEHTVELEHEPLIGRGDGVGVGRSDDQQDLRKSVGDGGPREEAYPDHVVESAAAILMSLEIEVQESPLLSRTSSIATSRSLGGFSSAAKLQPVFPEKQRRTPASQVPAPQNIPAPHARVKPAAIAMAAVRTW
jgi:hypothetical protein